MEREGNKSVKTVFLIYCGGFFCFFFKRDEQSIMRQGTILLGLLIQEKAKLYMKMKARKIASVKINGIGGHSGGYANEGVCFTWRSAHFSVYLDQ